MHWCDKYILYMTVQYTGFPLSFMYFSEEAKLNILDKFALYCKYCTNQRCHGCLTVHLWFVHSLAVINQWSNGLSELNVSYCSLDINSECPQVNCTELIIFRHRFDKTMSVTCRFLQPELVYTILISNYSLPL